MCQLVCDDPSMPDELLFGRVGYIYALLFVQQHLGEGKLDGSLILKVCNRSVMNYLPESTNFWRLLISFANSLDPDQD